MLRADYTGRFRRDVKRCLTKHWSEAALTRAMEAVQACDEAPVPESSNDHALTGDWKGCRCLHIDGHSSNWVLLYEVAGDEVFFLATGTHGEVFR